MQRRRGGIRLRTPTRRILVVDYKLRDATQAVIAHEHRLVLWPETKEHPIAQAEAVPFGPAFHSRLCQAVEHVRGQFQVTSRSIKFQDWKLLRLRRAEPRQKQSVRKKPWQEGNAIG